MAEPKNKNITDSKTKGTNGSHTSEKPPPNKQSKLWQLLALAKDVTKDVEAIQDYERTVEGRRALELDLEARNSENQRLREFNDKIVKEYSDYKAQASAKSQTLLAEFEQRYKTYESNKAAVETMEKQVAEMTVKLVTSEGSQKAKAAEVEKLKKQLKDADTNAKSHEAEIKEMNADCEMHRSRMQTSISELDVCKQKLSKAQGDLGEDLLHEYSPEDLKKLGMKLRDFSKKCHGLVMEYFSDPDGAEFAASEIEELKLRFPKIPLSTMTTRPAAQMRCAVADAIIAEVLTNQILVPFYLPTQTRAAASTVLDLFGDDERRRTIYRCQILRSTSDSEDVARIQDEIVLKASGEVRRALQGLVVAFKQAGFYNAVPSLFKEAQALWADVQHSRDLITADWPDLEDVQPSKYEDYDQNGASSPGHKGGKASKPQIAAVLFPQVATREDLIFNGVALWLNQGSLVAAAQETSAANGEHVKHAAASRRRSVAQPDSSFRR
ncbi:hypothetical protein BGZ63DRAFT_349962 [Mariannaea sp. PMI_226]|nr:hypothetical protein BGZ63DRAFT_349962 [Mariannaea sp. PMI_226]